MKTSKTLSGLRNDKSFDEFWKLVEIDKNELDIDDPTLPRKRKRPARLENYFSPETYHHPEPAEDDFRRVYFDALDYAVKSIESRFEQTDWIVFRNIQELFLRSLQGKPYKEELDAVMAVYGDDFNKDLLVAQLEELKLYPENSIDNAHELVKFLQQLTKAQKLFMSRLLF